MPSRPLGELKSMVGDSVTTVDGFRVEKGKVEEFARAIGSTDPVYRDEDVASERGHDQVPAPLTYAAVSSFPRYCPDSIVWRGFDLGFDREYVLHGEQGYTYERPLYVGDILDGETTLVGVDQRTGNRGGTMTFAEFETTFRTREDEDVLRTRATSIETQGAVEDPASEEADLTADHSTEAGIDATRQRAIRLSDPVASGEMVRSVRDVTVGDESPTVRVPTLVRKDFVRYAGASGDFNPIHYDESYARAAGNASVFGQGMLSAGIASRAVCRWLPIDAISTFDVRFESRVFPGDSLEADGTVTDVSQREAGSTVKAELSVTTDTDETVLTGNMTADLPE